MWYIFSLVLAASACARTSATNDDSDEREPWKNPYLPSTIMPILYNLTLRPDFNDSEALSFEGVVSIQVKLLRRRNTFILHAKQLSITNTEVFSSNGTKMAISSAFTYEANDYWVIRTVQPLRGTATLLLAFKGNITAFVGHPYAPSGFLRISYFNYAFAKQSWLWATNFRPSCARYVFPNFDDPRFKAKFRITIRHWRNFTALSNMPEESYEELDDLQETTFKLSPRMSSHVVGFAITDFDFKHITVNGKKLRVWAQPVRLNQVNYALNVTPTIMNYLQLELNRSYSLEKLDQIAVPGDLFKDATTNWGLVTYMESKLLVDETHRNDASKFQTLKLIGNAVAHNYFGNLVTCRHWDHVWLNEALSKFYEVRAVTLVDPTFYYNEYFYGATVDGAMNEDAANTSAPLLSFSDSSISVQPNFDTTRAVKGAAILRMAENIVQPLPFKLGVRAYISKNAYGTALTGSLWDQVALEVHEPDINIRKTMSNYMKKNGIPVVNIEKNEGRMDATQKQLLNYPQVDTNETLLASNDDWITFNDNRTGYYRVNYDAFLWNRIMSQLNENHRLIDQLTRSKLLGDAFAMVTAGELGYDLFLNLTRYASREEDLAPLSRIFDGFYDITTIYNATILRPFRNYILNLTSNLMDKLQVKDEGTYIEKQLRPMIMTLSCSSGHSGCIVNATRVFRAWIQNETANTVPKDLQSNIYCHAIANSSDESEWNTTLERYRKETSREHKKNLQIGLCCTRNATRFERLLDLCMDPTEHVFDCLNIISYVAGNSYSDNHAWKWLKRKYTEIDRVKGRGYVQFFLRSAVHVFNTPAQYQEVLDFYTAYPDVSDSLKASTKSKIDSNIRWMDKHLAVVTTWLETNAESQAA